MDAKESSRSCPFALSGSSVGQRGILRVHCTTAQRMAWLSAHTRTPVQNWLLRHGVLESPLARLLCRCARALPLPVPPCRPVAHRPRKPLVRYV
jgi:hypothetical protein